MSTVKNRVVSLILGVTLAFAMTGCGEDDNPPSDDVGSLDRVSWVLG
ncbi:MAG: hypothetical protein R3246_11325 [Acidimicrobiia bacterium]|nr:hypothetical protein [Acidimicrobiia bacterium]